MSAPAGRSAALPPKDPSRPRVAHLTTTDMSLDWLLGPQLRAFRDDGFDVVGISAPGPHVEALAAMGIPHVPIDHFTRAPSVGSDLRAFVELVRALRRVRPDVLHTHNPKPGILGRIAGRLVRVPVVINTQHGLYAQPDDPRKRRWAVYSVERIAAAFSHRELVQNPEDAATLVDRLRVPARRVTVLGNGVDLSRFDPAAVPDGTRARLRDEWGIADGEVVFGVIGRLVHEKGIREIIDAHRSLRSAAVPARFVVVGPGDPDKPDALTDAEIEAARANGMVFLGRRDDMPELYSAMDVFLTGTYREGFPRAAMEGAAMGLPIIATDIRGCRQVVEHEVNGLLVEVRSAQALAAAARRLVEEPSLRVAMQDAARPRALADFDVANVVRITIDAYRAELSGRRAARAS